MESPSTDASSTNVALLEDSFQKYCQRQNHDAQTDIFLKDLCNIIHIPIISKTITGESIETISSETGPNNNLTIPTFTSLSSLSGAPKSGIYKLENDHICVGGLKVSNNELDLVSLEHFTQTETSITNLTNLARAFLCSYPIIVQGENGCGKTFLINILASIIGQKSHLVEIHIDDQTDSKSLIGAFICSDVPGEFIWQPGLITQAVMKGYWLIIEGIDRAPIEVISAISSLLDKKILRLPPPLNQIVAHKDFRIFATRSVTDQVSSSSLLSSQMTIPNLRSFNNFWYIVPMKSLPYNEIADILNKQFPTILPVVRQYLLNTYQMFQEMNLSQLSPTTAATATARTGVTHSNNPKRSDMRKFTLRDIMKIARRISLHLSFNHISGFVTESQFLECISHIIDVYIISIRSLTTQTQICTNLIHCWGLTSQHAEEILQLRSPQLSVSETIVTIGNTKLSISSTDLNRAVLPYSGSGRVFAFTKQSLRLLERVAGCVSLAEPVLLVGETGCGKTTVVQELATMLHKDLIVQNLSLATDSGDLIGGFRPVTLRQLLQPTYEQFVTLFQQTFSQQQNSQFLQIANQAFQKQNWNRLLKAFGKASISAIQKLTNQIASDSARTNQNESYNRLNRLQELWESFKDRVARFEVNLPRIEHGFAFAFVEGLLVRALRTGAWLLLDEVNLAPPETLQSLSGILDGQSLSLTEKGDLEPVERHPDFRIFAAMNPPNDIGKRELPDSLRSRFTEIFVEELTDPNDLRDIVLRSLDPAEVGTVPASDIVDVYLACRQASEENLVDGAGQRPRYSLRSLVRSLKAASSFMNIGLKPLSRSLYEAFLLNFQTLLGDGSRTFMKTYLHKAFGISEKNLNQPPQRPGGKNLSATDWVLIKPFWLRAGPLDPTDWAVKDANGIVKFVLTPSVEQNIRDIAASLASNVAPILLQGPTSVGKTTMIEYLAARTGHRCTRINNHEHTDVQEYIGGYVTGLDGQLQFQDGLLVQALRRGDWIILDELNLAPSDVLEALNRLLDDNRELLIQETGEVVKPVRGFQLFATQNPPGAYGGRKPLSRAFRNRFIEIQIGDLPPVEVENIISQSCGIPPKFGKLLVTVMTELQLRRQQSSLFQGRHGSVTMRDLIKWGNRHADNIERLCEDGYMLLAEKLRREEEKLAVQVVIEQVCKCKIPVQSMYRVDPSLGHQLSHVTEDIGLLMDLQEGLRGGTHVIEGLRGVAVTASMRRSWRLSKRAVNHSEPVLLIGETGTGKTSVCQLIAASLKRKCRILNCHQGTETADIIGGLRPVRGREAILQQAADILLRILRDLVARYGHVGVSGGGNILISGLTEEIQQKYVNMDVEGFTEMDVSFLLDSFKSFFESKEHATDQSRAVDANSIKALDQVDAPVKKKVRKGSVTDVTASDTIPEAQSKIEAMHISDDGIVFSSEFKTAILKDLEMAQRLLSRYRGLFEWQDGPLVEAMIAGDFFILDEINLAEDAVIERLNSVLESGRSITLAEKGGFQTEKIVAHPNFRFLATMNPGGDFGKRELSPALRSRFTEIWIADALNDPADLELIIQEVLHVQYSTQLARVMVQFMSWVNSCSTSNSSLTTITNSNLLSEGITIHNPIPNPKESFKQDIFRSISFHVSIREVLAWSSFIACWDPIDDIASYSALVHGLQMVLLDGVGIGLSVPKDTIHTFKQICIEELYTYFPEHIRLNLIEKYHDESNLNEPVVDASNQRLQLGEFSVAMGSEQERDPDGYVVKSKTTLANLYRILRGMQLSRPILLEGPPGVGKTSLITTLAKITGHNLVRINLSEHSELSDLLGTDLPTATTENNSESTNSPKFQWYDGVFLTALKRGDWVLLDELNLAPQAVLEGLNACFDHREEVFIPEIGKTFRRPPSFRVFCAQNPVGEGGGRKGLPQSFLTRFSRVYVDEMTAQDMKDIASHSFDGKLPGPFLSKIGDMVDFIRILQERIVEQKIFARQGIPWEFNLRDIFRWCELVTALADPLRWEDYQNEEEELREKTNGILSEGAYLLFYNRMRSEDDRRQLNLLYELIFGSQLRINMTPSVRCVSQDLLMIGCTVLPYRVIPYLDSSSKVESIDSPYSNSPFSSCDSNVLFGGLQKYEEGLAFCVAHKWPALLVGPVGTGKKRLIRHLASISGNRLEEFCATSSTDSTELLGTFEQENPYRHLSQSFEGLQRILLDILSCIFRGTNTFLALGITEKSVISRVVGSFSVARGLVADVTESRTLQFEEGKKLLSSLHETMTGIQSFLQYPTVRSLLDEGAPGFYVNRYNQNTSLKYSFLNDILVALGTVSESIQRCYRLTDERTQSGGFEWVNGIVVEALLHGHWLIIDNVNLCSASVLDRLNSLLEPKGTLLLTERGDGWKITPHRNFRIFLVMDPCYGEISRAMRNRCVELAFMDTLADQDVAVQTLRENEELLRANEGFSTLLSDWYSRLSLAKSKNSNSLELPQYISKYRTLRRVLSILEVEISNGRGSIAALDAAFASILPSYSRDELVTISSGTQIASPNNFYKSGLQSERRNAIIPQSIQSTLHLLSLLGTVSSWKEVQDHWYFSGVRASLLRLTDLPYTTEIARKALNSLLLNDRDSSANSEHVTPSIMKLRMFTLSKLFKKSVTKDVRGRKIIEAYLSKSDEFLGSIYNRFISTLITQQQYNQIFQKLKGLFRQQSNKESHRHEHAFDVIDRFILEILEGHSESVHGNNTTLLLLQNLNYNGSDGVSQRILHDVSASSALYRLLDVTVFHRVEVIVREDDCRRELQAMMTINENSLPLLRSLFTVMEAISSNRLNSEYKETKILLRLQQLLVAVDQIVANIISFSIHRDLIISAGIISGIEELYKKRDILSNILRKQSPNPQDIPWEGVIICTKWIRKCKVRLEVMFENVSWKSFDESEVLERSKNTAEDCLNPLSVALLNMDRSFCEYWNRSNLLDKSHLWEDGGHPSVPLQESDWDRFYRLREMMDSFTSATNPTIHLLGFVETRISKEAVKTPLSVRYGEYSILIRDWLYLYCTFYWSSTTEAKSRLGTGKPTIQQQQIEFEPLMAQLHQKMNSFSNTHKRSDRSLGDTMKNVTDENENGISVFLSDDLILEQIHSEQRQAGVQMEIIITEIFLLQSLIQLSDTLALYIRTSALANDSSDHSIQPTKTDLKGFRSLLTQFITASLSHSYFDVKLLRAFQSIVWILDKLLASGSERIWVKSSSVLEENDWIEFYTLCRIAFSSLELHLYSIATQNISNNLNIVDFQWSSGTLTQLLNTHNVDLHRGQYEDTIRSLPDLVATGYALLNRPVSIQAMIRFLDIRAILPQYASDKQICDILCHKSAEVTISRYSYARIRIFRLFQMAVFTANSRHTQPALLTDSSDVDRAKTNDSVADGSLWRIDTAVLHITDVIISLKPFLAIEMWSELSTILKGHSSSMSGYDELFTKIKALNVSGHIKDSFVSCLCRDCLDPVIEILGNYHALQHSSDWFMSVGRLWVCVGILRVTLVLPMTPLDPATRAGIKANLLNDELIDQSSMIQTHVMDTAYSGETMITPNIEKAISKSVQLKEKINSLKVKAIQRSRTAPRFVEIFNELHSSVNNLVNRNHLLGWLQKIQTHFYIINDHQTSFQTESSRLSHSQTMKMKMKSAFEELLVCMEEEVSWQGSLHSFTTRTQETMIDYEDIFTPVLSSLQGISYGLRLAAGNTYGKALDLMTDQEVAGAVRRRAISSSIVTGSSRERMSPIQVLMGFPSFSHIPFDDWSGLKSSLLRSMSEVLTHSSKLLSIASKTISSDRTIEDSVTRAKYVQTLEEISPHIINMNVLSRMDYLLGCEILPPQDMLMTFEQLLLEFTESYYKAEERRKKLVAENEALFRNRAVERKYESDEVKEEEEALRSHFPDHLQLFSDIIVTKNDVLGDGTQGQEPSQMSSEQVDSAVAEPMNWLSKLEAPTAAALIGLHARMVFIYMANTLRQSEATWTRVTGKSSRHQSSNIEILNPSLRNSFVLEHLISYSMLTVRAFQGIVQHTVGSVESVSAMGSGLLLLSCMSNVGIQEDKSMKMNTKNKSKAKQLQKHQKDPSDMYLLQGVDIDLLFLLGYRCGSHPNYLNSDVTSIQAVDFHVDPNPKEAIQLADPLKKFANKLLELMKEFPGNEILIQIFRIVTRLQEFHINTPLGKLLASIELLLTQSDEWQKYAASHVSVEREIQEIRVIISRWRMIELKCWDDLLRCKEQSYAMNAMKYWFYLMRCFRDVINEYRAVQTRPIDTKPNQSRTRSTLVSLTPEWLFERKSLYIPSAKGKESSKDKSVDNNTTNNSKNTLKLLFETVDTFLRTSSVGEFPTRLHITRLFASQFLSSEPVEGKGDKESLGRIGAVIFGIWQYYEQYLSTVRNFQSQLRQPLQQKLKDEIKLSKWDQLSTYALIEHSDRIHRKLNRFIREYEIDVLKFPLSSLLQKEIMRNLVNAQGEIEISTTIPSFKMIFPGLPSCGCALPKTEAVNYDNQDDEQETDSDETVPEISDNYGVSAGKILMNYISRNHFVSNGKMEVLPQPTNSRLRRGDQLCTKIFRILKALLNFSSNKSSELTTDKDFNIALDSRAFEAGEDRLTVAAVDIAGRKDGSKEVMSIRYCVKAHQRAEELCDEIFDRINALRASDITRNIKQRAVNDLLQGLRGQGISSLRSSVPQELNDLLDVFTVSTPLAKEIASDLRWSSTCRNPNEGSTAAVAAGGAGGSSSREPLHLEDGFNRVERYYIRCLSELNQLRIQSQASFSPDISHRDVQTMMGLAENMFCSLVRGRCCLQASLWDMKNMCSALFELEEFQTRTTNQLSSSHSITSQEFIEYLRCGARVMLQSIVELRILVRTAVDAHSASQEEMQLEYGIHYDRNDCMLQTLPQSTLNKAMNTVNSTIENLGLAIKKIDNRDNHDNYEESVHVCGELSLGDGSGNDTSSDDFSESISMIGSALREFQENKESLALLVSWDVVLPVVKRQKEFIASIQKYQDSQISTVNTHHQQEVNKEEEMQVDHASGDGDHVTFEENIDAALTKCSEACLIIIQKLKALSSSAGTTVIGCFGEEIHVEPTVRPDPSLGEETPLEDMAEDSTTIISSFVKGTTVLSTCDLYTLAEKMTELTQLLSKSDTALYAGDISRLSLMLRHVLGAYDVLLGDLVRASGSFGKLTYIVYRVFRNLLAKGICAGDVKEEEGGEGGGGDGERMFQDDVEGTGMGEGQGKKDVSDQIENEEQLLGTKNEDAEGEKRQPQESKTLSEEEKDQGVEMTQDFDGELYDVPEDPEDENKDDQEEEDEGKEELDRDLGEIPEDADVVDEKEWNDDDDDDSRPQDKEQFEKDSKMKGEEIEGEMHTKEDDDDDDKKRGKDQPEEEEKVQKGRDQSDEQQPEEEGDGDGEEDAKGREEEEQVQKPQGVDVREDEFGEEPDDEADGQEGTAAEDRDGQEEEAGKEQDDDLPENMDIDNEEGEGGNESDEGLDEGKEEEEVTDDVEPAEEENEMGDEEVNDDKDDGQDEPGNSKTDLSGSMNEDNQDQKEPSDPEKEGEDNTNDVEDVPSASQAPAFGVQNRKGKSAMQLEEADPETNDNGGDGLGEDDDDDKEPVLEQSEGGGASSGKGSQSNREEGKSDSRQRDDHPQEGLSRSEREVPNPYMNRGDINKSWHRRLDLIPPDASDPLAMDGTDKEDADVNDADEREEAGDGKGLYEYGDDRDQEQVLGPVAAGEEEPLDADACDQDDKEADDAIDMTETRDEKQQQELMKPKKKRDREAGSHTNKEEKGNSQKKRAKQPSTQQSEHSEDRAEELDESEEESSSDLKDEREGEENSEENGVNGPDSERNIHGSVFSNLSVLQKNTDENQEDLLKMEEEEEEGGGGLNIETDLMQKSMEVSTESRLKWGHIRMASEAAASRLCEQLRLILEPTLASRMHGDYRTGKRINMRRVVGYLASGCRKDKIWLRRTKPAKRDYQIMLMMDNSSSMSGVGSIALSALATLSAALNKLEVGQLAVTSFAQQLSLLHPFGRPFDDEAGAATVGQLSFDSEGSALAGALRSLLPIFESAKTGASINSSVVLQLCFVISDARLDTDNRNSLRNIIRELAEKQILVVLVVIDKCAGQTSTSLQDSLDRDSIFCTKTVHFTPEGIVTKAYLDDFPFPYYVAVRHPEALPELLCDALKQWFEMIRNQTI